MDFTWQKYLGQKPLNELVLLYFIYCIIHTDAASLDLTFSIP